MSGILTNPWSGALADVSVRWAMAAAVDLALVYFLIYRLLLAIRGTRAAQIVVGIVLIASSFYVAERLELTTISWLLDNVTSYLLIIVIVVFQQDIRRALGRIGQVSWFGRSHSSAEALDEVVGAVAQLARAKRGAIIVVERENALEELVEDATRLDAQTSRQLLVALFVASADNELHDGAVVVGKNRRVEMARALLPLSRSTDLGPEFGTRHRAALGITEETDAVAVVVSEERGEISLCFRGSIARELDAVTLRRALFGLVGAGRSDTTADEAHAAAEIGKAVASLGAASETAEES